MMTDNRGNPAPAEPIGIVISSGHAAPVAPKFSAYVWGPAPEDVSAESAKAA